MRRRFALFISIMFLFQLFYTNSVSAQAPTFYTLADAEVYIRECAAQRSASFTLRLINREVYDMEESELWTELVEAAPSILYATFGITHHSLGQMSITMNPTYRSGIRMADAWRTGNQNGLSAAERDVLKQAVDLVSQLRTQCATPLTLEKAIYKELCARLTYTDRSIPGADAPELSALTALTSGRVNCQGYADAFYLLATLAGFEVDFQTGYDMQNVMHVWNTIFLDGQWYVVDVTSGDTASENFTDDFCYHLFNAGLDIARDNLSWPERWETVAIAPHSDEHYFFLATEDGFGYTCESLDSATRIACQVRQNEGEKNIWIMVPSVASDFSIDAFHDALSNAVKQGDYGSASWHIYYWIYGTNVYLCIQWVSWGG